MFTQRHYIAMADWLRSTKPNWDVPALMQWERMRDSLARMFTGDNERFKMQRFMDYVARK